MLLLFSKCNISASTGANLIKLVSMETPMQAESARMIRLWCRCMHGGNAAAFWRQLVLHHRKKCHDALLCVHLCQNKSNFNSSQCRWLVWSVTNISAMGCCSNRCHGCRDGPVAVMGVEMAFETLLTSWKSSVGHCGPESTEKTTNVGHCGPESARKTTSIMQWTFVGPRRSHAVLLPWCEQLADCEHEQQSEHSILQQQQLAAALPKVLPKSALAKTAKLSAFGRTFGFRQNFRLSAMTFGIRQ